MSVQRIIEAIGDQPLRFNNESELQALIAGRFTAAGIVAIREYKLSEIDRVDFYLPVFGVAVEIKVKQPAVRIFRQLARYAQAEFIEALVLICPRPLTLPSEVGGKPLHVVPIWRNML